MENSYWVGTNASGSYNCSVVGGKNAYLYGLTFRSGGGNSNGAINIIGSDGAHYELERCCLWQSSTANNLGMILGASANSYNFYLKLKNTQLLFGNSTQVVTMNALALRAEGLSISASGSIPNVLFRSINVASSGYVSMEACDLSLITGTLVGPHDGGIKEYRFTNCKLGSGVTVLGGQTPANKGSAVAWLFDCAAGDEHYHIGYYDAFGALTVDTGIYADDGAQYDGTNRCSWKIVTTGNCSFYTPFVTPWFDVYHDGTSAVTPSIEILRDGSTTAYQDDEVWGEWAYKGTSGSTQTTMIDDRKALPASAANQAAGVGTGNWTGESGSAWSGKLQPSGAITPAEIGHIRGRVCVGEPSITVYVDPQTRLAA